MKKAQFKLLIYQTYLQTIKNSVGTKMFRNVFVLDNGKKRDITKKGELSCALFVSSILKLFNLISCDISPHTTINGTIKNMLDNGWKKTKKLQPGNVILWEEKEFSDGSKHQHLGFYIGNKKAVSNSPFKKIPITHHYTFDDKRKIIQLFTHKIIK